MRDSIVPSDIGRALLVGSAFELLCMASSFAVPDFSGAQPWLALTQQPAVLLLLRTLRGGSSEVLPAVALVGLIQAVAYATLALGVMYCLRLLRCRRIDSSAKKAEKRDWHPSLVLDADLKTALGAGYGLESALAVRALLYYSDTTRPNDWIETAQMPASLIVERLLGRVASHSAVACTALIQGAIFSFLVLAAIYMFRILRTRSMTFRH